MSRALASIRKVKDIQPIDGADAIEVCYIGGWPVVVRKDDAYKVGDLVVFFEIDSFLPVRPEFEFLRDRCYKRILDGTDGFRLKSVRLRGQLSQGLVLKPEGLGLPEGQYEEGQDVSKELGVRHYDMLLNINDIGTTHRLGNFPWFIPQTDEERVQNIEMADHASATEYMVTEKLDGTSFTAYTRTEEDGQKKFGYCSRNWELKPGAGGIWGAVVKRYELADRMLALDGDFVIQGEVVGPKVQGNHYKINDVRLCVFRMLRLHEDAPAEDIAFLQYGEPGWKILNDLGLSPVPVVGRFLITETTQIEDVLSVADGMSVLNADATREGLVFSLTQDNRRMSFKATSNKYLLKLADKN